MDQLMADFRDGLAIGLKVVVVTYGLAAMAYIAGISVVRVFGL